MSRRMNKSMSNGGASVETTSDHSHAFENIPQDSSSFDGEISQLEEKLVKLYLKRRRGINSRINESLPTLHDDDLSLADDESIQSAVSFTLNKTSRTGPAPRRGLSRSINSTSFRAPLNLGEKASVNIPDDDGELFAQIITVRNKNKTRPNSQAHNKFFGSFRSLGKSFRSDIHDENKTELGNDLDLSMQNSPTTQKQFTVEVVRETSLFKKIIRFLTLTPDDYSYSPNQVVLSYINWTFRSSIITIMLSFTLMFFFICCLFALFLKLASDTYPECVLVGGEQYGTETSTTYSDSFHLSWTTFTTVGYGVTSPSTGNIHENQRECAIITLLCTFESFCGLLYAGFCTAILFGKVARVQSHAQVSFSNCICIQWGIPFDGASNNANEGESNSLLYKRSIKKKESRLMCPVLKFRLINDLANVPGGDILDAKINVVGRKEAEKSGAVATARYVKVRLQESSHPFFTRVWHVTHVLNKNSRLLSKETRVAIAKNDGFWPDHIDTFEGLKKALVFDKIVITLTGICDLSATNVQIAKKYSFDNVMIGYDFAPMVYTEDDGALRVDMSMKDDIVYQDGGPEDHEDDFNHKALRLQARNNE